MLGEYVNFGTVARRLIGQQCQYAVRLLDTDLGKGIRYRNWPNTGGNWHAVEIHRDDVAKFVQRARVHYKTLEPYLATKRWRPTFPPTMDYDSVRDAVLEDENDEYRFSVITDMYWWCAPVFSEISRGPGGLLMNHNEIGRVLVEAGVTNPDECAEDHESGGFYIYFRTREDGEAWIDRLNAYLLAETEKIFDPLA